MDPFSITCGVAGLVGLAQLVVERGFSYISTAKDTREDIRNLICEVATLSSILSALVPVVDELGKSGRGPGITKHEQISDCEGILQQLNDMLQKINPTPIAKRATSPGAKKSIAKMKESIGNAGKMAKWPMKKDETIGLLDRLQKHKTTFILTLSADSTAKLMDVLDEAKVTNRVLVDVRSEQDRVAEEKIEAARVATLCWLFPDDPANKHEDIRKKQHEGTGTWFFDTEEFKSWYQKPSWLFCHGKPGVGKTVLTSTVIDYMTRNPPATDGDIGIAYIYCGFKDRDGQTPAKIFASILRQLGFQKPELPSEIESLEQDYKKKGRTPPLGDLFKATVSLVTRFASAFVFFDALDEYDEDTRPELLSHIAALMKTNIRGFVTSRPHDSDIQKTFKEVMTMELSSRLEDIELFVRSRLSTRSLAADLVEKVVSRVLENADGVFLLAAFQIEFVIGKKRPRDVKNCLDNLPLGLEGTYDNIIQQINGQDPDNRQLALNALSWISHASRPLHPKELCIAMSIAEGDTAIEDDDILDQLDLVHMCGGLVTIDELSQTVRFVHYTVQEYLEKSHEVPRGAAVHAAIAKTCLTYLYFNAFDKKPDYGGDSRYRELLRARWSENVFYTYAALNWGYHTKLSDEEDSVLDMICSFPQTSCCMESAINSYFGGFKRGRNTFAIAAVLGLLRLTKALLETGSPGVDHKDGGGRSALSLAAENGHLAVVELLVGRDEVEADSRDKEGRSTLSYAAQRGHFAVVELLVRRDDVEADSRDNEGRSALSRAAQSGYLEVVELLVGGDDVEVDSRDNEGGSALSYAAQSRHFAVVEFLRGKGYT